jgi:hypothetical protein
MMGPDAIRWIKPEAEGLRITIPDDLPVLEHVGVITTFPIKGDFEITVGFDILRADKPAEGNGVGFELYLLTSSPKGDGLGFYRMRHVKEGEVYSCTRAWTEDGNRRSSRKFYRASSKSARFRLTRRGSEVTHWVAEGDEAEFRELHRTVLGPDDVKTVTLAAFPGKAQVGLDVRIKDFRVRYGGTAVAASPSGDATAPATTMGNQAPNRTPWLLIGLAGAGLVAGGGFVWWRRVHPQGSANRVSTLTFECGACGKKLRAKAELAGKEVKCPHCGQAATVPER